MGPSILDVGKFSRFFDPYPYPVGTFLLLSVGKFGQFLTPPPLKNADVLNEWSLCGTGNVNTLQIFPYNTKGTSSQISTRVRQVVNNGKNLVNVVKERPPTAVVESPRSSTNLCWCSKTSAPISDIACLGNIPILRLHIVGLILTYPPTLRQHKQY